MQSPWILTLPCKERLYWIHLQQVSPEFDELTPVLSRTARPVAYCVRRIWAAIKRETLLALSEGVCTPREIDAIFKDVLKTPKGPCEQMDVVGLDVVLDIENHYADSRAGIPAEPRAYLQNMIQSGRLGVKNGEGFYNYGKATADNSNGMSMPNL